MSMRIGGETPRTVTEPWDQLPERKDLPKAELNPLMNPTLGRNLGRWAQVYFTNPPEEREAAVVALLEELNNQERGVAVKESNTMALNNSPIEMVCTACNSPNDRGQRFCGSCGRPLLPTDAAESPVPSALQQQGQSAGQIVSAPPHDDVQWLRDRVDTNYYVLDEPQQRGWRVATLALIVLLVGFAGFKWFSRSSAPTPTAPQSSAPAASVPSATKSQAAPEPAAATPTGEQTTSAPPAPQSRPSAPTTDTPAAAHNTAIAGERELPAPASPAGNGAAELQQAKLYLDGKQTPPDASATAQLLWRAVAKQNTGASLLLADLYMRGDGVPKSCDQARLLLMAAVKKGDAEAAAKLREMQSHGCS